MQDGDRSTGSFPYASLAHLCFREISRTGSARRLTCPGTSTSGSFCTPNHLLDQSRLQILLDSSFYGPPVLLEEVGDNEFLGFDVGPQRTTQYRLPQHLADSGAILLIGFKIRILQNSHAHSRFSVVSQKPLSQPCN